mmetsp:Transcript_64378/g.155652  ORF Transcript_64378/g.155652 Transcript_64378/m.155652 type:complete len:203 (-) Transcript_64378:42-650(-)
MRGAAACEARVLRQLGLCLRLPPLRLRGGPTAAVKAGRPGGGGADRLARETLSTDEEPRIRGLWGAAAPAAGGHGRGGVRGGLRGGVGRAGGGLVPRAGPAPVHGGAVVPHGRQGACCRRSLPLPGGLAAAPLRGPGPDRQGLGLLGGPWPGPPPERAAAVVGRARARRRGLGRSAAVRAPVPHQVRRAARGAAAGRPGLPS